MGGLGFRALSAWIPVQLPKESPATQAAREADTLTVVAKWVLSMPCLEILDFAD